MAIARIVIMIVEVWLALGLAIAIAFLLAGLERQEPSARGSHAFRILLVPGMAMLWPLVLARWRTPLPEGQGPGLGLRAQRVWHQRAWLGLAMALAVLVALAQLWPGGRPGAPVQLAPAAGAIKP